MEWQIVLLVVPAIVVPVVLLFGFAGCSFDPPSGSPAPMIVSATGTSVSSIVIAWTFSGEPATHFQVERTKSGQAADPPFDAVSPLDDTGLDEGTTYSYRVKAVFGDGNTSDFSASVSAKTLSFQEAFSATLTEDEPDWAGFCLVQRIEPLKLSRSGPQVRITIRASTAADLTIDRIFISQPATAGDPYDSAADLTQVSSAVMVPANTATTLPPVTYNLDHTQPLLIAFDFSSTPNSGNVRRLPAVPTSDASAYFKQASEAAINDRQADYVPLDVIHLVEKIEVAVP
jgi:hypothetical protein